MNSESKDSTLKIRRIMERMVFIGGPPRSGTTFAAKSLNLHPEIITAIDDHVYECWGLYYYRDRVGLVDDLRENRLYKEEAAQKLESYLFHESFLMGAAPSEKLKEFPQLTTEDSSSTRLVRSVKDSGLIRHAVPVEEIPNDWYLCLKSPEVSHVLPQLSESFKDSRFVLVYRPIIEIAESMYRTGNMVKRFAVFHNRWEQEWDMQKGFIPPPGVPAEWNEIWQTATRFQRCAMYAASYIQAIIEGTRYLDSKQYFIYNHARLRNHPEEIYPKLAEFLQVDPSGFNSASSSINQEIPAAEPQLLNEYAEINRILDLDSLEKTIYQLSVHNKN